MPDHVPPGARIDRAIDLLNGGRGDLAEAETRAILAADPDDAVAHAVLALALIVQRRGKAALAEAREAIRLDPEHLTCRQALTEAYMHLGDSRRAEAVARAALRADVWQPRFHELLAVSLLGRRAYGRARRRRAGAALAAAEAGLSLDPSHPGCNTARAQALLRLGRLDEARAASAEALRLAPANSIAHAVRGVVELAGGDPMLGVAPLREALRLNPHDAFAQARLMPQDYRDAEATRLQACAWRPLVLGVFTLLAGAIAIAVVRLWLGDPGGWVAAALPLGWLFLVLLTQGLPRHRHPQAATVDLSAPGALTARERFWAKVSVLLWSIMSAASVATGFLP